MIHINSYIDKVMAADAKNSKEIILSIKDAKFLHADITRLLVLLEELRMASKKEDNSSIEIISADF